MRAPDNRLTKYFRLGDVGVQINFPDISFADQACRHIFLCNGFRGRTIAVIDYILDESVDRILSSSGQPNVVGIAREASEHGGQRVVLRMFDQFTVILNIEAKNIRIRFPSSAPVRLLLDDVFQAAMQPILDALQGFILHGSCMVRDGQAIVLMGNSGAGKSTTAFNLTRFGFICYADDAVLVTPQGDELTVWPLSRELSLRPISFKFFENQNIPIGAYIKDGQKYYFRQTAENLPGAKLKHFCFLNLSGNAQTTMTVLSSAQALAVLSENDRHFSFMGRKDAHRYAERLAVQTPLPLSARIGTDLDIQGKLIQALFSNGDCSQIETGEAATAFMSRDGKVAMIRNAWLQMDSKALAALIPLLGDFDPHVFKLALGFFQTCPLAKLRPLATMNISSPPSIMSMQFPAAWLEAGAWLGGCRTLLEQTGLEVMQQFAFSWFKSAPLLYPFMNVLVSGDPEKVESVNNAWARYNDTPSSASTPAHECRIIHIDMDEKQSVELFIKWAHMRQHQDAERFSGLRLYCWVKKESPTHPSFQTALKSIGKDWPITIVPIVDKGNTVKASILFLEIARQSGLKPLLYRATPLCCLTEKEAGYILGMDAFDGTRFEGFTTDSVVMHSNMDDHNDPKGEIPVMTSKNTSFQYIEKPFTACGSCGISALGLCNGGFFLNQAGEQIIHG
jgi:hypothetical protein